MINIWTWRDEISGFVIIVRIATRGRTKTCLCHSFKKHQITFDITHDIIKISYHTFHREKLFIVTFLIKKKKTYTYPMCRIIIIWYISGNEIDRWNKLRIFIIFFNKKITFTKKIKVCGSRRFHVWYTYWYLKIINYLHIHYCIYCNLSVILHNYFRKHIGLHI